MTSAVMTRQYHIPLTMLATIYKIIKTKQTVTQSSTQNVFSNGKQSKQNGNIECNVPCKRMKEDKHLTVWKEKKTGKLSLENIFAIQFNKMIC